MRILKMTATFGKLDHQTLTLEPGLNILEAPNEWGKSTWCAFLVSMLYGIPTAQRNKQGVIADKERYAPWSGAPMSGTMEILWQGRSITLERTSSRRGPMGDFRAYETESGLPVPELTAANCGQVLLGVEREVFTRAGFIRFSDLPVTQDPNLSKRLHNLVSTGDESGTGELLAEKLHNLKNRCRSRRQTGLLPEAEQERMAITKKLIELDTLEQESARLSAQMQQVTGEISALRLRLQWLDYEDYQAEYDLAKKLLQEQKSQQMRCDTFRAEHPITHTPESLAEEFRRLEALEEEGRQLSEEGAAIHGSGRDFPFRAPFYQTAADAANAMIQKDTQSYAKAQKAARSPVCYLAGALLAAVGLALLLWLSRVVVGCVALAAAPVAVVIGLLRRKKAKAAMAALTEKYGCPFDRWQANADEYYQALARHQEAVHREEALRQEYSEKYTEYRKRVDAFCDGDALQVKRFLLNDELAHMQQLVFLEKDLEDAKRRCHEHPLPPLQAPPAESCGLTLTHEETLTRLAEAEQTEDRLREQLAQRRGRAQGIGQREELEAQRNRLNARIDRLTATESAIDLAREVLEEATRQLQRRFAPRISRRAAELLKSFTENRYDRLTLDEDLALRAAASGEDIPRSVLWRSDGTADQLYLSLRLAVAEELTPHAPLILDDALVRFDDRRLRAALAVLQEESLHRQVLVFTCHGREKQLLP